MMFRLKNPYEAVANLIPNPDNHYKTNLHTHSTYSDANNTMADMIFGFYDNDFDILAFAEHGILGKEWNKEPSIIPLFRFQYLWHGKRRYLTDGEYAAILDGTYKTDKNSRTQKRGLMCVPDVIEANMFTLMKNHVNGYFTNEYKKHQIVISKTTDFYSEDEAEMISGAEVFIHDGVDTIYFRETERKGYYETIDSVAGVVGKTYYLSVNIIDEDGLHNYYSQSTMRENISQIDSMAVKEIENTFANNFMENVNNTTTSLYPYFQSVDDPDVSYLINIIVNDTAVLNDSFLKCSVLSLQHLSGMYFNSPEMVSMIGLLSAIIFKVSTTKGSVVPVCICTVLSVLIFSVFAYKFFFDGKALDSLFPKRMSMPAKSSPSRRAALSASSHSASVGEYGSVPPPSVTLLRKSPF